MEITGVDLAAKRHMSTLIHRLHYRQHTVLGWMYAMQTYYGKNSTPRIRHGSINAGKLVFNYWLGVPQWKGVDAGGNDYSQRRLTITRQHKVGQGSISASSYQMGAPIDKEELRAIQEDAPFRAFIKKISAVAVESLMNKQQADLFPTANQTGGTQQFMNKKDKIMSFAAGLQSGYAGNALTGSGTYDYLGIDLNANDSLKATNVGTDSSGWTLSATALEEDLIMPLRVKGSNIDTILLDRQCYMSLKNELGSTIQQTPRDVIKFPGPFFQMENGVFAVYEPGLDKLPMAGLKREIYVGDSETLVWGTTKDPTSEMALIEDWPEMPTAHLLQGLAQTGFANENPSLWGRAYNVLLP